MSKALPGELRLPVLTAAKAVARAEYCEGIAVGYFLGASGRTPEAPNPGDETGLCDCSAYTAWLRGVKRGRWNTDAMRLDAIGPMREFVRLAFPVPGCIVVYGAGPRVGHCGLVMSVPSLWTGTRDDFALMMVSHCSRSNSKYRPGHAIKTTSGEGFYHPGDTVFVWDRRFSDAPEVRQ